MTNIKKHCDVCSKEFYVFPNPQNIKQKFCSRDCYYKGRPKHKHTKESIEKMRQAKLGHGWPKEYYENQSRAQKERFKHEKPWNKDKRYGKAVWYWRDNPNAYRRLHKRIQRKYGTPKICEHCGRTDLVRYQWANKSGNYQENREDWIRLCPKCHYKYDNN